MGTSVYKRKTKHHKINFMNVIRFFESKGIIWLLYVGVIVFLFRESRGQNFVFPTENTSTSSEYNDSSISVKTESHQCPSNMKIYHEENNTEESFCDCNFGYLYFPPQELCFAPYRRGPCPAKSHLVLPEGETIARCKKNPCIKDELVKFNEECYEFEAKGPCDTNQILSVNETTFKLECIVRVFGTRVMITVPMKPCQPGTRRAAQGKCRTIV